MARQGDANAVSFLEFVARSLDRFDRNGKSGRDSSWAYVERIAESEGWEPDLPYELLQSDVSSRQSPLAKKIRSQYAGELGRLPALQIDALWNEISLYAQTGFQTLRQEQSRLTQKQPERIGTATALDRYGLPEIPETLVRNFLIVPLASTVSRQPIHLDDIDVVELESGRQLARIGYMMTTSATRRIQIAASVMEQIAQINGIDVSDKINRKNGFLEKLEGAALIHSFESYRRGEICGLVEEGRALNAFKEIGEIARKAGEYKVPLELLITGPEIALLKTQAVNHPERGLRGELLEIARDVFSGKTWRRLDLRETDELVAYCRDKNIVAAYQRIKSAIEILADPISRARYQAPPARPSRKYLQAPSKISGERVLPTENVVPLNLYPRLNMSGNDARAILSMFALGNLEGIIGYGTQSAEPAYAAPTGEKRRKAAGLAIAAGLAALIAGVGIFITSNQTITNQIRSGRQALDAETSQETATGYIREIDCTGIPVYSGSEVSGKGYTGEAPIIVCKPGTGPSVPRGDLHLPTQADLGPATSGRTQYYPVKVGDNLTHIMKRQAGITDNRLAYLEALNYAESHGIKPPYVIHPGQIITIRNP
ncbi:LysM peptidoglycan-binding domain-containing protein [Candidatus Woesearchaeota archaeon]|nr:LysM peptidoglycan-binding domain-containing protein [Candidatus Woesearchaeota archaeon]